MDTKRTPTAAGEAESTLLPFPLPEQQLPRVVLVSLRRMAAYGIRDAHAAMLMFNAFGLQFRRPLVLLRAFVVELAENSRQTIKLAPCCAMRMTADEASLMTVLASAAECPALAVRELRRIGGTNEIGRPLCSAAAFSNALADLGRPMAI